MDEVVGRSSLLAAQGQDVRLPVAHMVCNQTPPVGDKPSLMTFRYVHLRCHVQQPAGCTATICLPACRPHGLQQTPPVSDKPSLMTFRYVTLCSS